MLTLSSITDSSMDIIQFNGVLNSWLTNDNVLDFYELCSYSSLI
jgi:hypothetical protein